MSYTPPTKIPTNSEAEALEAISIIPNNKIPYKNTSGQFVGIDVPTGGASSGLFTSQIEINPADREGFYLGQRNVPGTAVPLVRASTTNMTTAFDVMPNGNPGSFSGNGVAWIDVCDADVSEVNGPVNCGVVAAKPDRIEFGSRAFNGASVKDVVFTHNNTELWRSNGASTNFKKPIDMLESEKAQTRTNLKVVGSVTTGITGANAITNIVSLTQAQYNALTVDNATLYIITDA